MGLGKAFFPGKIQPQAGESLLAFLRRLAVEGLPTLGYAENLREPVRALCHEVVQLRHDLDVLHAQVADLHRKLDG